MNWKATRLSPVLLVDFCCMQVNVGCEDAFVAEFVQSGVKSAYATKKVNKPHDIYFMPTVLKPNGGSQIGYKLCWGCILELRKPWMATKVVSRNRFSCSNNVLKSRNYRTKISTHSWFDPELIW